ncbi:VOC family protein [Rubinisphaera margarita]|uniref:VOC family protein n=1 Tax=Rubinisphaera margarita TaxID=2909586 RepID=UPI001EE90F05|nr:VOC family protein [Rubinisphaera margarita]MCG6157949.1 VOC family protein [Rubinisphaera margarita]
MTTAWKPDGYHSVTPYLVIKNASAAIEFYKKAFAATDVLKLESDGKIAHAEIQIGDSRVMLADEHPEMGVVGPNPEQGTSYSLMIYVPNVDEVFETAVAAGAEATRTVTDMFYGDRSGTLTDPFGHVWTVSTHQEDLSQEEVDRRFLAMQNGLSGEIV